MSNILTPIHTAPLGKSTLRFFKSASLQPDIPWHVHDDLVACMGLPRQVRRRFHQILTSGAFKDDARVVGTPDGIVTLAPHAAAQSLIGAAIQVGAIREDFEGKYSKAVAHALDVLIGDLPDEAATRFVIAATWTSLGSGL